MNEQTSPDGSFEDPTLIAGRPWGALVYVAALVAATMADVTTFRQVLELAIPDLRPQDATLVIYGFVGIALATMHFSGVILRERRAGRTWIHRAAPACGVTVWLVLGLTAFYVRISDQNGSTIIVNGKPVGGTGVHITPASAMFLGLYLGTGLVTLLGAYLTHNPARGAFVRTKWALIFASHRLAAAVLSFEMADGNRKLYELNRQSADAVRRLEESRIYAFAESLKQHARLVMAQRAKDPALTDALFPESNPELPSS